MAVTSFSNSGIRSGSKRNKFWDQSAVENSFFSIDTVTVGSGGAASVTFSSIPQTYTHLQIRGILRGDRVVTDSEFNIRINGDSGTNYSYHNLTGDGASATSGGTANGTDANIGFNPGASETASIFGVMIIDFLDYANTNKYKTWRSLVGYDGNGNGRVRLGSGNWRSTNAITSITFNPSANNFTEYSSFALYGIKG